MLWLAQLAERGPFASAAVAAGLILAALLLPAFLLTGVGSSPLLLFVASSLSVVALIASAAIVAFVVLRHGEMAALQVLAVCVVLITLDAALGDEDSLLQAHELGVRAARTLFDQGAQAILDSAELAHASD